jgi:hypothetical protein
MLPEPIMWRPQRATRMRVRDDEVRLRADGSVDCDFYRSEAAQLRREAQAARSCDAYGASFAGARRGQGNPHSPMNLQTRIAGGSHGLRVNTAHGARTAVRRDC